MKYLLISYFLIGLCIMLHVIWEEGELTLYGLLVSPIGIVMWPIFGIAALFEYIFSHQCDVIWRRKR